jgi:hypothetical protein
MRADLTETIFYTFSFDEIEKARKAKEGHLKNGFKLLEESEPMKGEDDGYFELIKKTVFKTK